MIMHALTAVLTGSNQNDQKKILKRGKRFCWPLIFGMILVCLILPVYIGEVDSKEWVFKPREKFNVNTSRWKKSLWRKALKKVDISKKFEDRLPRIPKFRPKKVIKDTGGKKPNPCQLVEKLCLNGGTCRSQGDEWFCDCPATHYGKSCEFLADQTYCAGNMCKNNSTCYSVKSPREVPNPMVESVKACSRQMMRDSRNEECKFTLRLRYQCWCRTGFEGSFCEFTEGLRCCAEDLCNDHGLIEYKEIFNQNHKDAGMNCSSPEVMNTCKCHCEEFYSGDNCLTTSPCRDRECLNGGKCVEDENREAKCECPKPENFLTPTAIQGDFCEKIDVEEVVLNSDQFRNCTPCGDAGFHAYLECMQTQLNEKDTTKELRLEHYFAQKCVVEGQHPKSCREALEDKFCLHAGKCTVSVADLSTFADGIEKPFLLLVPKCECPDGYEGDFCENRVLDECDYKDLETHSESLAAQNAQPAAEDSVPRKLGDEQFFRLFKNRIGTWRPEFYNEEDIHTGFERALRGLGMATYCGEHGLCRPFNEQAGIGCKCALGFKGPRCGQKDACSPDPCSKHTMCVEIPVKDDNEGEGGGGAGTGDDSPTNTCICDNSQSVDPRTHKCMAEHSAEYLAACYKEKDTQKPKCENGGSCYPCALDQKRLKESGLAKSSNRLALCDERETRQGFRCLCPPGFEPPMCRNGTTPCDYHQCQNGATCVPTVVDGRFGDYRCICPPGYGPATNNTLCHDIEDLCLTVGAICRSGKCVEDPKWRRGFRCDCLSGFYGLDCEHFEASSYRTYIDDHYTWTYPLLAFTLIVPLALLIMAFRDKVLSCALVGRLAQRLWRLLTGKDKGHYKPLEQEEDEGEGAAEGEKDENDEEKAEEKQEEKIEEKAEAEEAKEPEENENNAIVVDGPQILP